jgi:hypothetical protein
MRSVTTLPGLFVGRRLRASRKLKNPSGKGVDMKRWLVLIVLLAATVGFLTRSIMGAVAAAVQGTHVASGNAGYLGTSGFGVDGNGIGSNTGVAGFSGTGVGVYGTSSSPLPGAGTGVQGFCSVCAGVAGGSSTGFGVFGSTLGTIISPSAMAIDGYAPNGGIGVYGSSPTWAGFFSGDVDVLGTLYKSSGAFRIDHPLDPMNKFLNHSFVESPDMKNIYDGIVTLDRRGEAIVELPAWFDALNGDFRYQLTCIGEHAPVYIADEVKGNRFRIAGGYDGMKVSWQVTGIRHDPYAEMHRIPIEELKPLDQRGKFLHPDVYRMPESQGINYARDRMSREIAGRGQVRY